MLRQTASCTSWRTSGSRSLREMWWPRWRGSHALHISGVLRGILPEGTPVFRGMKAGDVDPRGKREYCDTVSDKALAVGGGVLEAVLALSGKLKEEP